MAKLSARGRKELVRVTREVEPKEEGRPAMRISRALMSDRTVLKKVDYKHADGMKHSTGWKVEGKAKEGVTPERFAELYAAHGYAVTT